MGCFTHRAVMFTVGTLVTRTLEPIHQCCSDGVRVLADSGHFGFRLRFRPVTGLFKAAPSLKTCEKNQKSPLPIATSFLSMLQAASGSLPSGCRLKAAFRLTRLVSMSLLKTPAKKFIQRSDSASGFELFPSSAPSGMVIAQGWVIGNESRHVSFFGLDMGS